MSIRSIVAVALLAPAAYGQRQDTLRLSIVDAVSRALRESDEVRLANAQVEVAEAQITTARAAGLPQLRYTGNYSQTIKNARAAIVGQAIFGQNYNYNTNVNLSQTLFQGGRIVSGARAAGSVRASARANVAETQAQLSVDIQSAYLTAVLARELEAIQTRNAELAGERDALVERLELGGRASRFEVLRARVERSNLEPLLLQARASRELADIEVRRLLNLPATQTLVFTSTLDTAALGPLAARVLSDSAPAIRSSVRAAEYLLDARKRGIAVARADLLPTVSAFFQTGFTALPASNGLPTIRGAASNEFCPAGSAATRICQNNGWFPDRSFGVSVAWPVFDGLRAKGNIDLAQAQERTAYLALQQEKESVTLEQARALAEFNRADAAYKAQRQNVAEADEAFRIAALRFERGLGTQLEVSDAQFLLLTAQTNAARATVDFYLAVADLARARGRAVPLPPTR